MANIQEIDIDKNLIIPIPQGLSKEQLALMVANHFNYQPEVQKVEHKEYNGTIEGFNELVQGKVKGEDYFIIEVTELETEVKVKYQEVTKAPNELTAYQFGIGQAIKPLGDLVRTVIVAYENAKIEADKKALEEKAQQNAAQISSLLDNITAL